MQFAYVTDHALLEECKAHCDSPLAVMVKHGESDRPRYEGDFAAEGDSLLRDWAQAKSLPLVIRFADPIAQKHLKRAFASDNLRLICAAEQVLQACGHSQSSCSSRAYAPCPLVAWWGDTAAW